MRPIIGLALFGLGVYTLATRDLAEPAPWLGFCFVALGLLTIARSRRRRPRGGNRHARPAPLAGAVDRKGGGDGREDADGDGDGGGDGGD